MGILSKVIDKQLDLAYQTEIINGGEPQYIWYIKNPDNNLYDLFTISELKTYINGLLIIFAGTTEI